MTVKKTLSNCTKPLYRKVHDRTFAFTAAICVAGSLLASPGAWAGESAGAAAGVAAEQVATLEPAFQPLEQTRPADAWLEPAPLEQAHSTTALLEPASPESAQSEPALGIDLAQVKDLASIVDEARKKAQVEYLSEKLGQPRQTLHQYVELAWKEASRREGLAPELLIAIMQKESVFRPKVQNRYGAQGLMQVVRRWHSDKLHKSESLFDPAVNVRVGTDILEEYLESYDGNLWKALAKYSGNSSGYAKTVINESRKLERVADTAAAQVANAPGFFEGDSTENAG
ncbi:MAG TPA: transglycosylase SLT domain-containing protein [Eoetvoesiella sp.]|uniref:transglycosylase SLT domain-containing protein n=1 Tax=Eoetvoesiella sp. TaxID=1966355 RepID=UPI002CBBA4C9|nr:transglycosylase SLT domain-containing protein [Eoetvoesiella sp.]HWK61088.1 transglycosylase SLT domain-containing protein [Eoetvoesiella sp.]